MRRRVFCSRDARWPPPCSPLPAAAKTTDEPPVATPSLTLNHDKVPIGSPVKLTYKFDVAPNAKIDGDYWVFVHVLDPDGEQLWTDDHLPPTPTSHVEAGQTVEYTRTVFVPNYPYIGEAVVRLGLYNPKTEQAADAGGRAGVPQGVPRSPSSSCSRSPRTSS